MAVDKIMDAFQIAADTGGLQYHEHHGAVKVLAAVSSMAVANRLVARGCLVLRNVKVPLKPVSGHIIHVSVYHPPYVSEGALAQMLSPNSAGKKDRSVPPARPLGATGARCSVIPPLAAWRSAFAVVMRTPRLTVRSRGLTRRPRFCPATLCPFPWSPPPPPGAPRPANQPEDDSTGPPVLRLDRPPPVDHPAPSFHKAPATPVPEASLSTAGMQDTLGVDNDCLSSDSDRLVIADQADVTPSQGHPAPTPTLPTSSPTCESSIDPSSNEDINIPSARTPPTL
ncbi:hypothetical protein HPB47_019419 [Ixodes persulcatus]|uniref:Uncharacterized protein n=1 Tax=Ixodes persulcatus TaxID=34615 RepID=A0AC60QKS6_IXOPE|nr:hypothetical protein HPB47_019419 [Ixodes persulcatus]